MMNKEIPKSKRTSIFRSKRLFGLAVPLLLGQFIYPWTVQAQSVVKNNLPCIAELCLGDGLEELQKIKWDPLRTEPFNLPMIEMPAPTAGPLGFKSIFIGRHGKTENYLNARKFDSNSLRGMANVKVACGLNRLVGSFTSINGNPTTVTISLGPNQANSTEQRWVVVEILRKIPNIVTDEQAKEAYARLGSIYKKFNPMEIIDDGAFYQPGLGTFMSSTYPPFAFSLTLQPLPSLRDENNYKNHPDCGGKAKISLD
jgi:hypothetical protein